MAFTHELSAEDRARAYDLLAAVFDSAPTAASTSALRNMAPALGIRCPSGPALGEIRREFMDLFVVPNPRYVAPYESAYRDGPVIPAPKADARRSAGLLMGNSTLAVRQAFIAAGVLPVRQLPDHIANELRLVGHLWNVEARGDAREATEARRQRACFVADHLQQWIADLGGTIARNDRTGFYRAAVETARVLLGAEPAELQEDVGEVNSPASVVAS